MKIVIFTDLDGTLLDHDNYSFSAALPALEELKKRDIPLVICSSKTRAEIEHYRKKLGNLHPFISENGGGIFVPKGYFDMALLREHAAVEREGYFVISLGAHYPELRKAISALRAKGFEVKGFGDMSEAEIMELAGLTPEEARMSKERDFDEPFLLYGSREALGSLLGEIEAMGLRHTEGRFFHIMGDSDKGRAVGILRGLYRKKYGRVLTAALGDGPNDIPMLEAVDIPVLVQRPDGTYDGRIDVPRMIKAQGAGPEGWDREVLRLVLGVR